MEQRTSSLRPISNVTGNSSGSFFFQPKLSINQPNDVYEREADHTADRVMAMPDNVFNKNPFFKPANNTIQRKCQACEEEETHVHRKESNSNETQGSNELDSYVNSLSSSGQQMSQTSRSFFEPRFGHDFSNVKVHTDTVAAKSAQSINALAYTTGNNIVFNSGQYSPESDSGKKLMAHELTHVVQQGNGISTKIQRIGDPSKATGISCPVATDNPGSIALNTLFPVSSSTLTPVQKTNIAGFVKSWKTSGSTIPLRVDGYASLPGGDAINWPLSCNRALAIVKELKGNGVPDSLIEIKAQGQTDEFGAKESNQVANISMAPAPATPETPKPNCPVSCSLPIVLFSDTTNCGSGDDFLNHDKLGGPSGTFNSQMVSTVYAGLTDADLLTKMKTGIDGIGTIGGAPGNDAADHFYAGSPTPVDHTIGTPIGAAANSSPSFKATSSAVEAAFHTIITGMAATPASNNCSSYALASPSVPKVNFPMSKPELVIFEATPVSLRSKDDIDKAMLKAVIGGTHGIEIVLTALSVDCTAHTYEATIHFKICDNFGVDDKSDLYSDSLFAFWVLQHMRTGHKAFVNNILLDKTIKKSF